MRWTHEMDNLQFTEWVKWTIDCVEGVWKVQHTQHVELQSLSSRSIASFSDDCSIFTCCLFKHSSPVSKVSVLWPPGPTDMVKKQLEPTFKIFEPTPSQPSMDGYRAWVCIPSKVNNRYGNHPKKRGDTPNPKNHHKFFDILVYYLMCILQYDWTR